MSTTHRPIRKTGRLARVPTIEHAAALGEILRDLNYGSDLLRLHLGLSAPWAHLPAFVPLELHRLDPRDPDACLIRLLFLCAATDPKWIPPRLLEVLTRSGLLEDAPGGLVRCPFVLQPYRHLLLLSDPPGPRGHRLRGPRLPSRDRVFAVDASTDLLARAVPPQPVDTVADVGCGTGVLGLLGARRASHIYLLDRNPRAVSMSHFNAVLNGVSAVVESRAGDLLEPLEGLKVSMVLANLPFIPTPEPHHLYWDGGRRGQDVVRRFVQTVTGSLDSYGMALFSLSVPNPHREDALETLARWLPDPASSILLLVGQAQPLHEAIPLLVTADVDPFEPGYASAVRRWWDVAVEHGLESVAPALAVVRADGLGARQALRMRPAEGDFGAELVAMLRHWRWLHETPVEWDAWKTVVLAPAPRLQVAVAKVWDGLDWIDDDSVLDFGSGSFRLPVPLRRETARVLPMFDGLKPVQDVVFQFTAQSGHAGETVRARLLEVLPQWVKLGWLHPVADEAL